MFNAYATSAMCSAGIPTLDVFEMSEAQPSTEENSVLRHITDVITTYFRTHPSSPCSRKVNATDAVSVPDTRELPLTDGTSPALVIAGVNAASEQQVGPLPGETTGTLMLEGNIRSASTDNLVAAMETDSLSNPGRLNTQIAAANSTKKS